HRDVGVRMGLAIAVAALDQCEADGNSVSVAVVDRAGRLRVFLQADKANPHNLELARRKAYTARTFGRTSAEWAKRMTETPELAAQRELADVIAPGRSSDQGRQRDDRRGGGERIELRRRREMRHGRHRQGGGSAAIASGIGGVVEPMESGRLARTRR